MDIVNTINCKTLPSVYALFCGLSLHIGELKWSCMASDFNGWLVCDGRSLSREDYPDLFKVIGTSFGADNGETFKIPDMRGRVMGGIGQGPGLTNRVMGALLGSETHTLTTNEMPQHVHTGETNQGGLHSHQINDPGHRHTQTTTNDDFNNSGTNPPGFTADSAGSMTWNNINTAFTGITMNSNGVHTHTFNTNQTGGGASHNNMQPTAFVGNVFIYAKWVPAVISHAL